MRKILVSIGMALVILLGLPQPAEAAVTRREHAVRIAVAQRGDPYVYGAVGPRAFDCSGLIYYSYRKAGFRRMPRTAEQQYRHLRHIPLSHKRRGDILFYHNRSGYVYHSAIYIGHGKVIEAQRPGTRVKIASVWHAPRYAATTR